MLEEIVVHQHFDYYLVIWVFQLEIPQSVKRLLINKNYFSIVIKALEPRLTLICDASIAFSMANYFAGSVSADGQWLQHRMRMTPHSDRAMDYNAHSAFQKDNLFLLKSLHLSILKAYLEMVLVKSVEKWHFCHDMHKQHSVLFYEEVVVLVAVCLQTPPRLQRL